MKLDGGIKILVLVLLIASIFFPILGNAQQIDISVSAEVGGPGAPPLPPLGGIYIPPETEVIFEGRAYPLANLTILKNNTVIATLKAEQSGLFEKEIKGIAGGTYNFSIFAEDTEGRKSVTIGFTVSILEGRITTVSGIFIPPTIEVSPISIRKGEMLNIFGQVFPESKVYIFVLPIALTMETIGSREGNWSLKLDTTSLETGEHKVKAKSFFGEGEQSEFSGEIPFEVSIICKGADLNFDGAINVFDFSILLHWWEAKNLPHSCVDINFDKIVDVIDFSVMMHYWTD